MGTNIKKRYPTYLKEFKCIGGACEDSCCIGWNIDIDKITFRQYYKVKDEKMKKMFQKNVHNNEYKTSDDVDYGQVKLKKDKRCPFLDEKNYCIIQSNLGEEYLSSLVSPALLQCCQRTVQPCTPTPIEIPTLGSICCLPCRRCAEPGLQ